MRLGAVALLALLLAPAACDEGGDGDADGDADVDGDTDVDGDSDADADTDGDSAADADVDRDAGIEGCADPADPTLTDAERRLLAMPADSWLAAPGTRLLDVCDSVTAYGDGVHLVMGCTAVVSAWSGGAFDATRGRMIVWGGGHNDYGGNEVYAFDLRTMTWAQLTEPSPPPFGRDPLEDGRPVSRHTYDGVEVLAHRDSLLGWGGSRATDGAGTDLTWELDLEGLTWTNRAPTPPRYSSPYDFGLAYDPVSRRVFLHSHAVLSVYDPDSNVWTELADFGYPPWTHHYDSWSSRTGAVDPVRRLFVTLGGGAEMLVWDIDAGEVLSLDGPWSGVTGGEEVLARPAPGLDFDVAAGQLVAWSGGAPVALDEAARSWLPLSGEGAPAVQNGNGTFGRFRYVVRYNVFVLVSSADADVMFYKHTPGCGE